MVTILARHAWRDLQFGQSEGNLLCSCCRHRSSPGSLTAKSSVKVPCQFCRCSAKLSSDTGWDAGFAPPCQSNERLLWRSRLRSLPCLLPALSCWSSGWQQDCFIPGYMLALELCLWPCSSGFSMPAPNAVHKRTRRRPETSDRGIAVVTLATGTNPCTFSVVTPLGPFVTDACGNMIRSPLRQLYLIDWMEPYTYFPTLYLK